jgi:hypothetical protein
MDLVEIWLDVLLLFFYLLEFSLVVVKFILVLHFGVDVQLGDLLDVALRGFFQKNLVGSALQFRQ